MNLAAKSALLAAAALTACGTTEKDDDETLGGDVGDGPVYAIATSIFGQTGSATYVSVFNSLDTPAVSVDQAAEFAGFATIGTVDEMLFVGDGEAPELTRYRLGETGLTEDGTISFANHGLPTAPLYTNIFVDADTAYMNVGQVGRVVWDPTAFAIKGTAEAPGLKAEVDDLAVRAGYDRSAVSSGGFVFQPFYWSDNDYYRFLPSSRIAVYSEENDALVDLLDAPCPGLDVATKDDEGNLYFSNWVFPISAIAVDGDAAPQTCVVRIKAGERVIDEDFTRDLSELTEGRPVAAFRHLEGSVGVAAVFHTEDFEMTGETNPAQISWSAPNWKLWRFDLEAGTAAPIDGLGFFAGGYYSFQIDGRTILLVPAADYSSTKAFELTADGAVVERFTTPGWAYQLVKVR